MSSEGISTNINSKRTIGTGSKTSKVKTSSTSKHLLYIIQKKKKKKRYEIEKVYRIQSDTIKKEKITSEVIEQNTKEGHDEIKK